MEGDKFAVVELSTQSDQEDCVRSTPLALRWLVYTKDCLFSRKCRSTAGMTDRTVVITGGNAGIGRAAARDLAARGARVILACRDLEKGRDAAAWIERKVPGADVQVKPLDLASLASVRACAEDLLKNERRIHVLINNAGMGGCPKSCTEDGFERQFGVNHLGHFLLTNLLLERIKESAPARIVVVASLAHMGGKLDFEDLNLDQQYHPIGAYCRSKLCNVLFARELAKRLRGTGVTTYSLHPGAVHTGLGRHLASGMNGLVGRLYRGCSLLFFKSAKKGAQTVIHCAVDEQLAQHSGQYYCDCTPIHPSATARDDKLAAKLWEVSESLVNTTGGTSPRTKYRQLKVSPK